MGWEVDVQKKSGCSKRSLPMLPMVTLSSISVQPDTARNGIPGSTSSHFKLRSMCSNQFTVKKWSTPEVIHMNRAWMASKKICSPLGLRSRFEVRYSMNWICTCTTHTVLFMKYEDKLNTYRKHVQVRIKNPSNKQSCWNGKLMQTLFARRTLKTREILNKESPQNSQNSFGSGARIKRFFRVLASGFWSKF